MGDTLTSEQREYRRFEQEREDAAYARRLASESARQEPVYHRVVGAPEDEQQLVAGRRMLPPIKTFLCCISLRCGVLIIAGCDVVAAICQGLASLVVLVLPELVLEADDDWATPYPDMAERSRRFLLREMRLRCLLSALTVYYGVRGYNAVQRVDARGLREYLNWKVLVESLWAVMGVALHRLWWDGCGFLPSDSCWDMRYTYLTNMIFALPPPVYCIWAVWSLYWILTSQDRDDLAYAGFVPQAEQADYPAFGGNLWSQRDHKDERLQASPRTTYMV